MASLTICLRLYGDPRGRGSFGVPIMLFLTWRIGLISRALKRIIDAEVADMLFDATLYTLESQQLTKYQDFYKKLEGSQLFGNGSEIWSEGEIKLANRMMYISNLEEGIGEIYHTSPCLGKHPFSHWTVHRHFMKSREENQSIQTLIVTSLTNNPNLFRWFSENLPSFYPENTVWKTKEGFTTIEPSLAIYQMKVQEIQRGLSRSNPISGESDTDLIITKMINRDRYSFTSTGVYGYSYSWGSNNMGQLGSIASAEETTPLLNSRPFLIYFPRPLLATKNLVVREVACGYSHSLAILASGNLLAWGSNKSWQLGLGQNYPDIVPSPLPVNLDKRVKTISCGSEHSVALTEDRLVFAWGQGEGGLLGSNSLESQHSPQEVKDLRNENIITIVCGGLHSLALTQSGQVWSWGRGEGGQLGHPRDSLISTEEGDLYLSQPKVISSFSSTRIIQLAAGDAHSLALEVGGTAWAWGFSTSGQLGTGAFSHDHSLAAPGIQQFTPALVKLPPNKPIKKVPYFSPRFMLERPFHSLKTVTTRFMAVDPTTLTK